MPSRTSRAAERLARFEQSPRQLGVRLRVDPAAQADPVDVLLEADLGQHLGDAQRQLVASATPALL